MWANTDFFIRGEKMKKQVVPVDILAKVQANIDGALGQVDKLQKHLSTLKFPDGSTKNLDSSIEKIIEIGRAHV